MNRISTHYDPYYSPNSPVGMVRGERLKYLAPQPTAGNAWARTEMFDPSSGTVVDPEREAEGAQLLLDYYKAVGHDRTLYQWSMLIAFIMLGGLGVLLGWLFSNLYLTAGGIFLGAFIVYLFLTESISFPRKRDVAKRAFDASGYFRDRSALDGYLITTHDPAVIWEALDLENRRRAVDHEAIRLGAHQHLPEHRKTEITELQDQEQVLRRRIVDMLDPQHREQELDPQHLGLDHPTDGVRAVFASQVGRGRLFPEGGEPR